MAEIAYGATHEQIQAETDAFVAPRVYMGQIVYWFINGDTSKDPRPAVIVRLKGRAIDIREITLDQWGLGHRSVHHHDDPVVKYNSTTRVNNGTWDFTTTEKVLQGRLTAIEATLTNILGAREAELPTEDAPAELSVEDRKKIAAYAEANKLRLQAVCESHGLVFDKRLGVQKLNEMLQKWEQSQKKTEAVA